MSIDRIEFRRDFLRNSIQMLAEIEDERLQTQLIDGVIRQAAALMAERLAQELYVEIVAKIDRHAIINLIATETAAAIAKRIVGGFNEKTIV